MKERLRHVGLQTVPMLLGILLSYLFWRYNTLLLVVYAAVSGWLIASGKDRKTEVLVYGYGCILGFLIEAIGTSVSGYQSFTSPDMFGIPWWLVLAWGYGFVLMKRISLAIARGNPWVE